LSRKSIQALDWVRHGLPPRDKAPRHKADDSSPSITDIKNEWSHISTPLMSWQAWRYLSLYLEGQTDINVGKKQTIIFGHINVTNSLTTIQSIKDKYWHITRQHLFMTNVR
jgi:hypothetical protein